MDPLLALIALYLVIAPLASTFIAAWWLAKSMTVSLPPGRLRRGLRGRAFVREVVALPRRQRSA